MGSPCCASFKRIAGIHHHADLKDLNQQSGFIVLAGGVVAAVAAVAVVAVAVAVAIQWY